MMNELELRINNKKKIDKEQVLKTSKPKNLLLEVSNACNDKCIFCANRKMTRKRSFMNLEIGKRVLKEGAELGVREVGFYATGEPLLNEELELFIESAKRLGYTYTYLTTNGVFMTEERIASLLDSGIDSIKFSVNASNRIDYRFIHGTDDFDKVIDNIRNTARIRKEKKSKTKLFVSCVMTRQTQPTCSQLDQIIGDCVDEIIYQEALNFSGCMKEIGKYLSCDGVGRYYPKSGICPYPFTQAIVTCEGYLTLCCLDYQNYMAIADLNNCSLEDAWFNERAESIRNKLLSGNIDNTLCSNCLRNESKDILPLCDSLCTKVSMKEWGEMDHIVENRIKERDSYIDNFSL